MTINEDLARFRDEYARGNIIALLEAIMACAQSKVGAPGWIVTALAAHRDALAVALKPPSQKVLPSGFDAFAAALPKAEWVPAGKGRKILAGRASHRNRKPAYDKTRDRVLSEYQKVKHRFGAIAHVAMRVNLTPQRVGQILRQAGAK